MLVFSTLHVNLLPLSFLLKPNLTMQTTIKLCCIFLAYLIFK